MAFDDEDPADRLKSVTAFSIGAPARWWKFAMEGELVVSW